MSTSSPSACRIAQTLGVVATHVPFFACSSSSRIIAILTFAAVSEETMAPRYEKIGEAEHLPRE